MLLSRHIHEQVRVRRPFRRHLQDGLRSLLSLDRPAGNKCYFAWNLLFGADCVEAEEDHRDNEEHIQEGRYVSGLLRHRSLSRT